MKKDRVLFVYEDFSAGGSTTSFFELLRAWDYEKYDVDILPYRLTDTERERIARLLPDCVNILENAVNLGNSPLHKVVKGIKAACCPHYYRALRAKKKGANKYVVLQHMAYAKRAICRRITGNYRAVISFIEGWSTAFALSDKICADKRIVFVHLDYKSAGLLADIDRKLLGRADGIAAVSESCAIGLKELYPEYKDRITVIENLHSVDLIRRKSVEGLDSGECGRSDFLTVCRPDIHVKGLDRLRDAAVILRDMGYRFKWTVVGVGGDARVRALFENQGLEEFVTLVDTVDNPFPYYTRADWLVVTSRTEAKPMTVTEAQILGVPCIVTEYSSAREQVHCGEDGIITENTTEGIVSALRSVLDDNSIRGRFAEALKKKTVTADADTVLGKLYSIIDGK